MKYVLPVVFVLIFTGCKATNNNPEESLVDAVAFLWEQQQEDGGWHSPVHGIASGGESWTPFILYHLLQVPESVFAPDPERVLRGLAFVRRSVNNGGIAGHGDPIVLDYPNYASSYALRVLHISGTADDAAIVESIARYLREQQMNETRGFDRAHPAFGGWGFGEKNLPRGEPGHVDLSHTRRVVEALSLIEPSDSSFLDTQIYLNMVQKRDPQTGSPQPAYDGGFYASSVVEGVNKGGWVASTDSTDGYFRSYATATADGALTLLAAGVPQNDDRVLDAHRWLLENGDLMVPAGIPENSPIAWDAVMFYYHLYSRCDVYARIGGPANWQTNMGSLLASKQEANGSFSNPFGSPNKEDDPLIATTFAVSTFLCTLGL